MKVILYMAMSVDGYIATLDDETPWSESGWRRYIQAVDGAGCLIIGRRTYEIMKEDEFDLFTNLKRVIVLTENILPDADPIISIATSPKKALSLAKQDGFTQIIIGGGLQTNRAFLQEQLVEEVQIDIEPMLLGEGIPLLEQADKHKLRKKSVEELDEGVIHVEYEVVK